MKYKILSHNMGLNKTLIKLQNADVIRIPINYIVIKEIENLNSFFGRLFTELTKTIITSLYQYIDVNFSGYMN